MLIRVKLFAVAKQAAGADFVGLEVRDGATIGEVREALVAALPDLAAVRRHLLFAVDTEYAGDAKVVRPDSEVACIPPVSGG
jgi:molybdopterin converting factor subunit 1